MSAPWAAAAEELGSSVQEIGRQIDGSAGLARRAVAEAAETAGLVRELSTARAAHRRRRGAHHSIAGQTNLLAAQRHHRGGRAGRGRTRLRRGRGGGQGTRQPDRAGDGARSRSRSAHPGLHRQRGGWGRSAPSPSGSARSRRSPRASRRRWRSRGPPPREIVRNVAQAAGGTSEVTRNIAGVARRRPRDRRRQRPGLTSAGALAAQSGELTRQVGRSWRPCGRREAVRRVVRGRANSRRASPPAEAPGRLDPTRDADAAVGDPGRRGPPHG